MESQHAPLALVIAGNRAGFFVHAPEGAIQSVRSYEEFSIADPKPVAAPVAHAPARLWPGTWRGAVAGWLALIALPVAALAYLRPAFPGKSAASVLQVQEDRGLLRIRWQAGEPGILEIQDGADRLVTPVFANQSGAAYERHSRDVGVSLIRVDGGSTRRESTRFVGGPLPAAAVDQLRSEISQIKARARHLRSQSTARAARILALEKAIEQNTAQHTAP
jgi:hypothetical protein